MVVHDGTLATRGKTLPLLTGFTVELAIMPTFDPYKHHRRSIRLKQYDYRQAGAYFVTICVQNQVNLFGTADELNIAGRMVEACWLALPNRFSSVALDEYVVMPNHFHAIVHLTNNDADEGMGNHKGLPLQSCVHDDVGAVSRACPDNHLTKSGGNHEGLPLQMSDLNDGNKRDNDAKLSQSARPRLGDVIGAFKSITTNQYIDGVRHLGWPPFDKRVWQRNYYEHIIRHDRALRAIREYIRLNPRRWMLDRYNSESIGRDPKARELWDLMHCDE